MWLIKTPDNYFFVKKDMSDIDDAQIIDIPEGYYFEEEVYKRCNSACLDCNETKTLTDTKCLSCSNGYNFIEGNFILGFIF